MAIMNRLSSLIVRRDPPPVRRAGTIAVAAAMPASQSFAGTEPSRWLDDLRLFATGWIGGLIFFGTFLG